MEVFTQIMGWLAIIGIICIAIMLLLCLLCDCASRLAKPIIWRLDAASRRDIASKMMADSWWFSESPETQTALHMYADKIITQRGDTSELRDRWRAEVKKETK
jgi:hypothetical protein